MTHLMVLTSSLANKHLRENDLVRQCDVEEFLAAAEAQFSEDLRRRAAEFLDDGTQERSYEEWRAALETFLMVIDQDENLPYGG